MSLAIKKDVTPQLYIYCRGAKKKPYLTAEQFKQFLNTEQRDPRLNEILYPYTDTSKAQALIDTFEHNHHLAQKGNSHCM